MLLPLKELNKDKLIVLDLGTKNIHTEPYENLVGKETVLGVFSTIEDLHYAIHIDKSAIKLNTLIYNLAGIKLYSYNGVLLRVDPCSMSSSIRIVLSDYFKIISPFAFEHNLARFFITLDKHIELVFDNNLIIYNKIGEYLEYFNYIINIEKLNNRKANSVYNSIYKDISCIKDIERGWIYN